MRDKRLEWPKATRGIIERAELKLRRGLDKMTAAERAGFWREVGRVLPLSLEPGDVKTCAACGSWFRRAGDLCGDCELSVVCLANDRKHAGAAYMVWGGDGSYGYAMPHEVVLWVMSGDTAYRATYNPGLAMRAGWSGG